MPVEPPPRQTAERPPRPMPEHIRAALDGSEPLRPSARRRWIGATACMVVVIAGAVAAGWGQLPH